MENKNTKNILVILIILGLIVVGLTIYILKNNETYLNQEKIKENQMETVVISQVGELLVYLPLYVAIENNYFEEENLNIKLVNAGGDDKAFASVISKKSDFGLGDPTFVAISKEKGGEGKIVGTIINKAPFWLVSDKLNKLDSASDFKGKKIVTYPKPSTAYTLTVKLAQEKGLVIGKDYEIIQSQFGAELGPLSSNIADASLTLPPTVQQSKNIGAEIIYSYPKEFGPIVITGFTTTDTYIKENPQKVEKLVRSMDKSLKFIHQNPDETILIAQKKFPNIESEVIEEAVLLLIEEEVWPKEITVDEKSWNKALDIRRDIGDLNQEFTFDELVENPIS